MSTFQLKKLLPLYFIFLISCGENTTSEVKSKGRLDTIKSESALDTVSRIPKKNNLGKKFDHSQPFEVISFNRGITLEYTGPDDTSECKKWNIKKENLNVIFKNSEPIDGTTWDLAFAFTTCVVNGQLKQNDEVFDYSVNGGSWFRVICRDTSMLFGDFNKRDGKFFLDSVERH